MTNCRPDYAHPPSQKGKHIYNVSKTSSENYQDVFSHVWKNVLMPVLHFAVHLAFADLVDVGSGEHMGASD